MTCPGKFSGLETSVAIASTTTSGAFDGLVRTAFSTLSNKRSSNGVSFSFVGELHGSGCSVSCARWVASCARRFERPQSIMDPHVASSRNDPPENLSDSGANGNLGQTISSMTYLPRRCVQELVA